MEDPVVRDQAGQDQVGQDQAEVRVLRQGPVEAMADPVARVVQAAMAVQGHARTFCLPDSLGQAFFVPWRVADFGHLPKCALRTKGRERGEEYKVEAETEEQIRPGKGKREVLLFENLFSGT